MSYDDDDDDNDEVYLHENQSLQSRTYFQNIHKSIQNTVSGGIHMLTSPVRLWVKQGYAGMELSR